MAKKIFNKLVRDKIPQVIKNSGDKPYIKVLSDEENLKQLNIKLTEEVNEYLSDNNVEELADIVEVIYGLLKAKNVSIEDFEKIRLNKKEKRGGFENKIFLEYTTTKD
ncbi:MAG: nucleoside triphosphate pyrophosphohydrolase [Clostridia bacterium]|nr:nucleoside triphosphate pyrophosphohydrolase [Clostridia bacterium]